VFLLSYKQYALSNVLPLSDFSSVQIIPYRKELLWVLSVQHEITGRDMKHWALIESEIFEVDVYSDVGCTNLYRKRPGDCSIGYIRRPTKTEQLVFNSEYNLWHGLKTPIDNFAGLIKSHWRKERAKHESSI